MSEVISDKYHVMLKFPECSRSFHLCISPGALWPALRIGLDVLFALFSPSPPRAALFRFSCWLWWGGGKSSLPLFYLVSLAPILIEDTFLCGLSLSVWLRRFLAVSWGGTLLPALEACGLAFLVRGNFPLAFLPQFSLGVKYNSVGFPRTGKLPMYWVNLQELQKQFRTPHRLPWHPCCAGGWGVVWAHGQTGGMFEGWCTPWFFSPSGATTWRCGILGGGGILIPSCHCYKT